MGIESINEPGSGHTSMLTPASINEPPRPPDVPPSIEAIDPANCEIGSPDFTLTVHGENFFPGSVIHFAGHDEPTTFHEAQRTLSTGIKPSLWTEAAVVQCSVLNGSVESNAVDFTFEAEVPEADPDDLEDEIEAAAEEGDFKPLHRGRPTKALPHKRKK